ncbi:MAG TPA: hypothetical protein VMW19_22820 [Myxococcota bacterium]|nr:hypothetical protein [Myxococcota bacterium]
MKRARPKAPAAARGPVSLEQAKAIALARRGAAPAAKKAIASASPGTVAAERRRLELRKRADLKERIRLYEETYAVMQQRGVKSRAPAAKASIAKAAMGAPLRIMAEGDSWFDYPVLLRGGLITRLEKSLGLPILDSAEPGDEVRYMLGVKQRTKLEALFAHANEQGRPWDVLLFSGGGNDIVGEPLCLWVRPWVAGTPPDALIDKPRFEAALGIVRAGYEDLIAMRDRLSPGTRLVFHAYDFALPTGEGVCMLGPWLAPSFDYRGYPKYPDFLVRAAVVKQMLLQFAQMLAGFQTSHPANVTFIDAQGTLDTHPDWWDNELHPNSDGFDLFAARFDRDLRGLYPGRFP